MRSRRMAWTCQNCHKNQPVMHIDIHGSYGFWWRKHSRMKHLRFFSSNSLRSGRSNELRWNKSLYIYIYVATNLWSNVVFETIFFLKKRIMWIIQSEMGSAAVNLLDVEVVLLPRSNQQTPPCPRPLGYAAGIPPSIIGGNPWNCSMSIWYQQQIVLVYHSS